MGTKLSVSLLTLSVLIFGLAARLGHIFNFYVYPDSYYYLVIADNLNRHGTIFGRLGAQGMHFPPVGSALFKPVYPMAVAVIDRFADNLELSGHIVAVGASVLSIYVAYLLGRHVFDSYLTGVLAAFLLAGSYNHTFWSGFIMGDSLSVLALMVALLLTLRTAPSSYGHMLDLLAGVALAVALLSRVTYAVVLPGLVWLMIAEYGWSKERLLTIFGSFIFTLSSVALLLLPPFAVVLKVVQQTSVILRGVLVVLVLTGAGLLAARQKNNMLHSNIIKFLGRLLLWFVVLFPAAIQILNMISLSVSGRILYSAWQRFIYYDPVLVLAYFAGIYLLLVSSHRRLGLFCALNILLLLSLYYQVATWEFRYLLHLMPFLILPGAFALSRLVTEITENLRSVSKRSRILAASAGIVTIILLFSVSFKAIVPSKSIFLSTSYPREVSRKARPALAHFSKDTILISALPWPYYFHLGFSTWGIDAYKPEKVLKYLPKKGSFVLISDLSMRYHLPALAKELKTLKGDSMVTHFPIGIPYQYAYFTIPERHEVEIYKLSYKQLRRVLRSFGESNKKSS